MMLPGGIPPLLFVLLLQGSCTSSDTELITVSEKTQTANEGSSVTIPCSYNKPADEAYTLLWFKDPEFDKKSEMFNGTIVYSNTQEHPQSPGYSSRVEYITDATQIKSQSQSQINQWIKCDLRITDLKTTDSGNYKFRFIGTTMKYMSKALSLRVKENPCKVQIEPSKLKNPLNESEEFTVDCSSSSFCDHYPEWLVQTSGQKQEWTSTLSTDMITETKEGKEGRKVTKLTLKATWKDDNRTLSCRPANSKDSWQIRNITLFVEHAPKETKVTVSSEYVKEGDSVTLSCTSRGHPDVSFTWFKNQKMEKSQMSDLKLTNVKQEDTGDYYCEAKNKHGAEESAIVKIDVKYGPQNVNVQSLHNITDLKEGDKLILKCLVQSGNPAVYQFNWYKDSQDQNKNSEIFIINTVTPENRGSYQCQADNGIKTTSINKIQVSVKYSPRNIQIKGITDVKVGTRLTLTCSADADPTPLTYTWKHTPGLSSVPLLSMKTAQLNIQNVTIQHAGQYTCHVANKIGTRSLTTEVKVLYPPSNLNLTMKTKVIEFEVISIICTVQSFPESKLTVTGPLGDQRYIQDNQRNTSPSSNMMTVYLNATESDAGTYTCNANNKEGEKEIKKELNVLYVPKNVTVSIKGEQTFGSELTLTCEARANPDLSSYEWKKCTNEQLQTVGKTLHFHSLEISDSGQYVCIAHNPIGKTASPSVDIKVKYAPNINIVHNMTTLTQWNGEFPVYLTCNVNAYPPATDYKWFKEEDNTTVLSKDQNFTVQPQNPGIYYCTATNAIGKSRSENIKLFISNNSLMMFYQIILPIILLLILIVIAIFLIRRTIIKARSDQQNEADTPLCFFPVFLSRSSTLTNLLLLGSRNNTQENLSVESIPDSGYERINQSHPTPNSHDPTPAEDLNTRPKSNIQTVYAAIKLPQMKHTKHSPKQQKMDNGAATLNYVTIDFKGKNEAEKRLSEGSAIYTVVSKNKQTKNSQSENPDYENVSSTCVQKVPFTNTDWESDTSEEDEVNYTAVSCSAKPAVKEPKHNQKRHLSSSSSDDEDRTEYSAVKL